MIMNSLMNTTGGKACSKWCRTYLSALKVPEYRHLYEYGKKKSRHYYTNRKSSAFTGTSTCQGGGSGTGDSLSSSMVTFQNDPINKIGYITLDSPATYNALSVEMGQQFELLIHNLTKQLNDCSSDQNGGYNNNSDKDICSEKYIVADSGSGSDSDLHSLKNTKVIILKGANHNFSSGGDLTWLRNLRHNPVHINADKMYCFYKSFLSVRSLPIPTIAYIEGYAIGAGACLALATDLRVMHEKSKIGFNFVKLGIHSGMGGSHLLSNVIGESKAKLALLTGKVFNAQEAFDNGIAHQIILGSTSLPDADNNNDDKNKDKTNPINDNHQHPQEVLHLAKQIASMHPLAIRSMVQTMRMREDAMGGLGGLDATLRREAQAQALCYAKSDWGEGLDAVIERRQPNFGDYHDSASDW